MEQEILVKKPVIMQNPGSSLKPRLKVTKMTHKPFTELEEKVLFEAHRNRTSNLIFKLLL